MLPGPAADAGLEPLSIARSDLPRELAAAVGAALDVANAKRAISCAEVASWIKKVARLGGGREELRALVTALAPPAESESSVFETSSESLPRVPMLGWSVRLAPIASKVLSVRSGFARLEGVRAHLARARAYGAARWPRVEETVRSH